MDQQIHLPTNSRPCEVELILYSNTPQSLRIVGYDNKKERYFDRNVITVGNNPMVIRFGCPISPKTMNVVVSGGQVKVASKLNSLQDHIQINPKVIEYVDFVKEFCGNYDKYPPIQKYKSRSGKYCVKHVPSIIGSSGASGTPARIHKTEHYIEVSNDWFREFTIPMRVFVLCHEYSHVYLNRNPLDEKEADLNGAKLYLQMGFPVIELIYSFTKVFGDSPQTRERARLIVNWLYSQR